MQVVEIQIDALDRAFYIAFECFPSVQGFLAVVIWNPSRKRIHPTASYTRV